LQLAGFGSQSWRVHGVDDTVATLVGERSCDELAVARRGRRRGFACGVGVARSRGRGVAAAGLARSTWRRSRGRRGLLVTVARTWTRSSKVRPELGGEALWEGARCRGGSASRQGRRGRRARVAPWARLMPRCARGSAGASHGRRWRDRAPGRRDGAGEGSRGEGVVAALGKSRRRRRRFIRALA